MALPGVAELLSVQVAHTWLNTRWVLDGLTDEEYTWEPCDGCWSVRRRAPGVAGWGTGEWVCEDAWPAPDPLPVTTIAWRIVHLAAWTDVYVDWTFGTATRRVDDAEIRATAADALRWLLDAQDRFAAAVDALTDDAVFERRPAHWGARVPVAHLVTLMMVEHVHHVAEVGVLRDLRRGAARKQPLPPLPSGRPWWLPTA